MNVIVCLDDAGGMAFNGRRQSKDRVVCEKILHLAKGRRLLMNAYSKGMFLDSDSIFVAEDFLQQAKAGDFCFVETQSLPKEVATRLFVFYWNRSYPADVYLGFEPEESGFRLIEKMEFCGFSHEQITLCVFERKEGKQ